MKILIYPFILFAYFQINSANKLKNSEIYEIAKEILNSFAFIDKNPLSINYTDSNTAIIDYNNDNNNILLKTNSSKSEDKNKTSLATRNQIVFRTIAEKKTEADILREEFHKVLLGNKNKNNVININNIHLTNKNNAYSNEINGNTRNRIKRDLTSEVTNDKRNLNEKAFAVNYPNNKTKTDLKSIENLNKNNKAFKDFKNQTTFIEINSDIMNSKNQINISSGKNSNSEKENKKLLLLRLKNFMEKFIDMKQKKDKKERGISLPGKQEENMDRISNKPKEHSEENDQEKILMKIQQSNFLRDFKDDSSHNNEQKEEAVKQTNEINQVTTEFLNSRNNEGSVEANKAFINSEDCNQKWDYKLHGNDWQCMCNSGKNQSPIDVSTSSKNPRTIKDNIFFDFKDPEFCHSDKNSLNNCKLPIIKNNGKVIEIDDDCGKLIMPQHLNGYKCYKISLHSPAEHKINGKQLDMEIKIHFRLEDKRIVDQNTKDYVILVVLVRGINENNARLIGLEPLINHPFLDQLRLNTLPKQNGESQMLPEYLDYNSLFNKSKQPYKLENNGYESENTNESDFNLLLNNAFNDLAYDKHFPLDEYFIYNGSFTSPPCEENVTYVINPNFLYAPFDQILNLSQVLIFNGNSNGNNRRIQSSENLKIYYFKKRNELQKAFIDLDLFEKKDQIDSFDEYSNEETKKEHSLNSKDLEEGLYIKNIDELLNAKNTDLREFMKP